MSLPQGNVVAPPGLASGGPSHRADATTERKKGRQPNVNDNPLLDAALAYAARGWRVFPLGDETKIPQAGSHGYLDATCDPAAITAWWSADPTARVALSLRASGLIAIDVDPRNGGDATLAKAEATLGPLPRELHQRSPSGGEHILMLDPSPGPEGWTRPGKQGGRIRGKLDALGFGPGVDVKCNGYIVVEPSSRYEWVTLNLTADGRVHVPALPAAWCEALRKPEADLAQLDGAGNLDAWRAPALPPPTDADIRALRIDLKALGPRGSGHATTFHAIRLTFHAHGFTLDEGWPILLEWDASNSKPHGLDLDRQVHQILTQRGLDPRTRGHQRASLDPDEQCGRAPPPTTDEIGGAIVQASAPLAPPTNLDLLSAALASRATAAGPPPEPGSDDELLAIALREVNQLCPADDADSKKSRLRALLFERAADLLARSFPPAQWRVRGLITRLGTGIISTEPKVGKTWAATEIAVAVSTNTLAFGQFEVEPCPVAYFYPEDVDVSVRNRLRALVASRGGLGNAPLYVQPKGREIDLTTNEDAALLIASCRRLGGVGLLVLDPLRNIHSGDEDKSGDMARVFKRIRAISTLLDCCVLVVHHNSKSTREGSSRRPGQKMRGSSAIHGFADSGLYLDAVECEGAVSCADVRGEVKAARSPAPFRLTLRVTDDNDGFATAASWEVGEAGTDAQKAGVDAEAKLPSVLEALYRNLGRFLSQDAVRGITGGAQQQVRSALMLALDQGLVRQDKTRGWQITPKGRDAYEGHGSPRDVSSDSS